MRETEAETRSITPATASPAAPPRPFALAAERGILCLPGSDPLPLAAERDAVGRYGFVVEGAVDPARYAAARIPDPKRHFLIENSIFEDVRLAAPPAAAAKTEVQAAALPEGRPIVLYAGTFEVYQGLEILIPAFALARAACPEAFLVLIGGTPAQVQQLRELAGRHGLAGHALIEGHRPKTVAMAYAAQASVLVSPRTHGSNTPLKSYEQLASGIPLAATRIPSHTQVLSDEVCVLVEPEPQAMAEGLTRTLTDREAAARIATNASALYERAYARPVYEDKMRALFELLGCTAPAAADIATSLRRV